MTITEKTTYEELLASGKYFTLEQARQIWHEDTLKNAEILRQELRKVKVRNNNLNFQVKEYA